MKHAALILSLALSGCVQTRTLDLDSPRLRADVNGRATTRTALVTLAWGETVRARSFHLAPDVATWLDLEAGGLRSVPASDIARVQFLYRGRGALEGAGFGVVATGVVAAATGIASAASGDSYFGPAGDAAIIGVITGPPLVLLGALGGAVSGSRAVYKATPGVGLFVKGPSPFSPTVGETSPASVQTDTSVYVARSTTPIESRRGQRYPGRYAFTIIARYTNASANTVYLAQAPQEASPAFTVRTIDSEVGAVAGSAYMSTPSGMTPNRVIAVEPGETRTDTLQVEGPRRDLQSGAVRGLMQGRMAIVYVASSSRDSWRPLPDSLVVSNPFSVRPE